MNNDGFYQYLKSNNFLVTEAPYSHLLMNGGKLFIPSDKRDEFLVRYAHYCQTYKLYVIELKTPIFRFFLDLDFFQEIGLPHPTLLKYIVTMQKAMYTILSHNHDVKETRVIACITKNKSVVKNNTEYVKTGVHVYWPDVYINIEYALIFRVIILDYLEEQYGERGNHNTWADVIDKTVLERNGLRMIGSRKLNQCTHCKSLKVFKSQCTVCDGTGKIDECRIYEPWCVIDGKGKELKNELNKLKQNAIKKIKETSIQSDLKELPKTFTIPEKYMMLVKKKKQAKVNNKKTSLFDIECNNKESLEKNSKSFKMAASFIRDVFPHPSYIDIIEIFKHGKETFSYIVRTSSRYCLNINREHHSNHVYYVIEKNYAYQKCFCTCDTLSGRMNGKCMDYKSSGRRVPGELQKLLFPLEAKKMAILVDMPTYKRNDTKKGKNDYVHSLENFCSFLEDDLCKRQQIENNQLNKV